MKKLCAVLAFVMAVTIGLSGCNYILGELDTLLLAPKPQGELGEISDALEIAVGKKFTLKSPKSGEWRSAYVVKDIDGDKVEEALCFYTIEVDGAAQLHMSVISGDKNKWQVLGDVLLGGTDIQRVDFGDFNGDGIDEAAVAWSIYGAPETRISVVNLAKGVPASMLEEGYTEFCILDMNKDGRNELMLFSLDSVSKATRCSMYSCKGNELKAVAIADIGVGIAEYKEIHKTEVDGTPALFVDATASDGGMFTEIVTFNGKKLTVPLSRRGAKSNVITGRYQPLLCGDVNGDGTLEIPCMTVLPNGGNSDATLCLTEWKSYSGGKLETREKSVVSKLMQYKITVNEAWQGKFTCVYTGANDGTDLYTYKAKKGLGDKVLSIIALSQKGFEAEDYKDMFIIDENDKTVYLGKIHSENNSLGLDEAAVKKIFSQSLTEGNKQ